MGKGREEWEGGERETRREGAERGEKARLGYLSSGPLYIVPIRPCTEDALYRY